MSTLFRAVVWSALLGAAAIPALAEGAKYPLKGIMFTSSTSGAVGSGVVVSAAAAGYGVGSGNVFVVKEICGHSSDGKTLACQIAPSPSPGYIYTGITEGCVSFEEGYVVPEGFDIVCGGNPGGAPIPVSSITVSGIVTKKQ